MNLRTSQPNHNLSWPDCSQQLEIPDYNPLIENRGRFTVSFLCSLLEVKFLSITNVEEVTTKIVYRR